MRIEAGEDDAIQFISAVNQTIEDFVQQTAPPELIVIKIDNWFGRKWLGFAGRFGIGSPESRMYGVSVWKSDLRIPPFVPNRAVSQRRFAGPALEETDPGEAIHKTIPNKLAIRRKASEAVPKTALIWYSGNSKSTGRGSMMVYPPDFRLRNAWYVEWRSDRNQLRVTEGGGSKKPALSRVAGVRTRGPRTSSASL